MAESEPGQTIDRVGNKLKALRQRDKNLELPCAADHGYELRKVVAERDLAAVEKRIGTALPQGYRAFLRHLGDGGAGPYYGLRPLHESLALAASMEGDERYADPDAGLNPLPLRQALKHHQSWGSALATSFPLTDDVHFADELPGGELPRKEHCARLRDDAAYQKSWDAIAYKYDDPKWTRGTLRIIEYGCGDCFFVVINGPAPDIVWVDSIEGTTGIYSTRVSFLSFYERWLDHSLLLTEGKGRRKGQAFGYLEHGDNPRYGSKRP